VHLLKLKEILPNVEEAIDNGGKCLEDMKVVSERLEESLDETVTSVNKYFTTLIDTLKAREGIVLAKVRAQAKRRNKKILKHVSSMEQAIDVAKKTKLTMEDSIERKAEEIDVLLEENHLRGRIPIME
jgi:hypothetical protein